MSAQSKIEEVACPNCNAQVGEPCVFAPSPRRQKPWHEERAKAKETDDDANGR